MNDEELGAKIDSLVEINQDIRQWLKVLAWDEASEAVERTLGDGPAEYELYEELDGETPISEVIENVSVPRRTVYSRLTDWQRVGIISKVERGKYEKIASLDSLGISPPAPGED